MKFPCPKCEQSAITIKDKYRLAYWREAHCGHCNARVCNNPWFLAPFSLVYMWLLAASAFFYMFEGVGMMALVYVLVGWLVIDFFNLVLIPMSVLRSHGPSEPGADGDAAPEVSSDQSGRQA